MLTYDQIRFFLLLAEHKSISKAAREYHTSTQNAYRILNDIELTLGHKLFTRSKNGYKLTYAGDRLIAYAKQFISLVDEINYEFDVKNLFARKYVNIRLHETVTPYLAPQIASLIKSFDDTLGLKVNSPTDDLIESFKEQTIDIVFSFRALGKTYIEIGSDMPILLRPKSLFSVYQSHCPDSWKEGFFTDFLSELPFIAINQSNYVKDVYEHNISRRANGLLIKYYVSSIATALKMCCEGHGFVICNNIIASLILSENEKSKIVAFEFKDWSPNTLYASYNHSEDLPIEEIIGCVRTFFNQCVIEHGLPRIQIDI